MRRWFLIVSILSAPVWAAPDVIGPNQCSECHVSETQAWRKSHHSETWNAMHRKERAHEIASRLGLSEPIKENGLCLQCHYTAQGNKPIAGVSCESCHGPAKDWINLHMDKSKRPECEAAGMCHPDNLYSIAKNCFECHTVPNEELVNRGGHRAGSRIELVAWTQGEVRHNFSSGRNVEAPVERRRILLVLGELVNLEYTLRALAEATENGTYAKAMGKRFLKSRKRLEAMQALVPIELVRQALDATTDVPLKVNHQTPLIQTADTVAAVARTFSLTASGAKLVPLDPMLPTNYRGTPFEPTGAH
jgi:hypothetical protein